MEKVTKKNIVIVNAIIWLVAALWFATGYLWGTIGALEDVQNWFIDKYDGIKQHLKREA